MVYEDLIGGKSSSINDCFLSMSGVYDPTKYAEIDKSIFLGSQLVSDTWRQLSSGTISRYNHSAITYNNGTDDIMIVFGGHDGSNYLNDTWEYNITTDTWTQLTSGATSRNGHTAITYNNGTDQIMIVFGGIDGSNYLNDTWEYNITTDTWTQLSSGATGRRHSSTITYNNGTDQIMIIFGGYDDGRLNDTWKYNITTDTWTQLSSGAIGRSNHTAITYNNGTDQKMIVFGGYSSSRLNDTWEYNITTDTWTQLSSGATARHYHSAITYNNGTDQIMIVFGGYGSDYLNDIWEYNITTDTWTQLSSGATGRYGHSAITYNNSTVQKMIVFGGEGDDNFLNDTWEYNIFSNKFNNAKLLIPIKD